MTHAGYIVTAWSVSLGAVGLYSWHLLRRGRALGRSVPETQRRWMTSEDLEP
jgi:hypothetical protein